MKGGNSIATNLTHVPCLATHVSGSSYQRARVNVFIPHPERQQLDQLAREWSCPLVEVVRRVIGLGLRGIMQAETEEIPAF